VLRRGAAVLRPYDDLLAWGGGVSIEWVAVSKK